MKELVAGAAPKSEKKRRFDHSSDLGGIEASVEDLVGSICDSESKEGAWMAEYDIVKRGAALKLENQVGGNTVGRGQGTREWTRERPGGGGTTSGGRDMPTAQAGQASL